jgi:protease IV
MFRFLREVLASTTGVLLAGVVALFLIVNALPQTDLPEVPEGAVLLLDPSLPFADNPIPSDFANVLFGEGATSSVPLGRVRDALRAAAQDDRIVGLELTGYVAPMGWASLTELRREIVRFGESGKPILADFDYYDEDALFLASAADTVYLTPLSDVEWNGLSTEVRYLARAMEKAGIEVQVTRVGKYKSAVEPYLSAEMSAENRAQIEAIFRQQEDELIAAVAAGRAIEDPESLRTLFTSGAVLSADQAIEFGLIDGVRYWDEVAGELRAWTGDADPNQPGELSYTHISLEGYLTDSVTDLDKFAPGATVAVVYAEGEIVGSGAPGVVAANRLAVQLADLRLDDDIAAVVLRIQSPGGSAAASEFILREVELLAAEKPLIVSMGDVAASGGYWIATRANEIFAESGTITGSIGVYGMYPNVAQLMDRLGVDVETVSTGPHANLYSLYQSLSPETLVKLQAGVDRVYEGFLDRVASGRSLEREAVHEIAQGRVWTGQAALELGLVDRMGSLPDAIERAAELAGLKEGYAVWHDYHEADEWEKLLSELLQGAENEFTALQAPGIGALAQRTLWLLSQDGQRTGVWARLPYTLRRR